jgi:CBS domain-containing protein
LKVDEMMSSPVLAVKPADTIAHAKNVMLRHKVKRLVVIDKGKPVGMLTVHDIADLLRRGSPAWRRRTMDDIPVSRAMHGGIISVSVGTELGRAASLMFEKNISSLVVMDGNEVAGMLTKTDLVRYFSRSFANRLKVRDLMSKDVVTVNRLHSIARVVEVMEEYGVRRVVVVSGEKPVGLISESDIAFAQLELPGQGPRVREVKYARRTEKAGRPWARHVRFTPLIAAEDIMREELITIGPEEDAARAASIMVERGIGGIPVVEGEKLVGIVTKTDITRAVGKLGD